jgi:hypothetical protein
MVSRVGGTERVEALIGLFGLDEFRCVRQFDAQRTDCGGNACFDVELLLETEDRTPNVRAKFLFTKVRSFRIDMSATPGRILGFEIFDVSDRHWEGIQFEIRDFENAGVHWYSQSAEIVFAELVK